MLAALKAIGEAITWFIRLLAAAVSFPFGVAGTLPPWRLRTGLRQWAAAASASSFGKFLNKFTAKNVAMFLVLLLDALTIPVGAVASFTWRSPQMWKDFAEEFDSDDDDDILDFDRRFVFWRGFVLFVTDVPFGLMGVLNTVMVWHAPFFYTRLYREYRRVQADANQPDFEWRSLVFLETLTGLAEMLLLPFGLLVAATGYRVLPTLESLRYVRDHPARSGDRVTVVQHVFEALKVRAQVLYHGANVLLDFCYLLMAVWTTALLVRVPALVADVRDAARGAATWHALIRDVRKAVLRNFLLSFRELAGTVAYLVLLPTGYRFFAALTSAREKSGSMADPTCHTRLTSAVPEILKRGGVKVHVKGSKPKDLVFTTAKLYLRGEDFWDKVAESQGAGLTMVGKAFLPFDLCPTKAGKHVVLKTEDFKEGSTEFETTLHFELQSSKRCILRKVGEIGRDVFATIVVEFGTAHDGTLFDVCSTLGNFVDCSEEGRSLPVQPVSANTLCIGTQSSAELRKPPVEGPLFCDVMTAPALLQLVYFLGDLCALVLFVLLHLFPWRAWSLYRSYFATRAATAARRTLRTVDELGRTLRAPRSCPHALLQRMNGTLDAQVKQGLLHVPSVASGFATAGRFSQRSKIAYRRRRMYVGDHPKWYIQAHANDADDILAIYDRLTKFARRLDRTEPELARRLRGMLGAMYTAHAAYCAFGIDKWRCADQLGGVDAPPPPRRNKRQRAAGAAETSDVHLEQMCEWLSTVRLSYLALDGENHVADGGADASAADGAAAGDADDADDADAACTEKQLADRKRRREVAEALEALKYPYKVALREAGGGGSKGGGGRSNAETPWEVTPAATSVTAAYAWRSYETHLAAFDRVQRETVADVAGETRARLQAQAKEGGSEKVGFDWARWKTCVFFAVRHLAVDLGAVLSVLVVALTLYRLPVLVGDMRRRLRHGEDWRTVAFAGVVEIPIDFLYLLKVVAIVVAVRSAPSFFAGFVEYTSQKRSFAAARAVVDYYFFIVWTDLLSVLTLLFSCRAVKWALGCVSVGILTPGVLFHQAFFPDTESKCFSVFCILLMCGFLYVFPCVAAAYLLTDGQGQDGPFALMVAPLLCMGAAYLFLEIRQAKRMRRSRADRAETPLVPASAGDADADADAGGPDAAATKPDVPTINLVDDDASGGGKVCVRNKKKKKQKEKEKKESESESGADSDAMVVGLFHTRFVRPNCFNVLAFLAPLMEAFFLVALVGKLSTDAAADGGSAAAGCDVSDRAAQLRGTLAGFFSAALLEVGTGGGGGFCPVRNATTGVVVAEASEGSSADFPLGVWVALGMVVLYYFVLALPVVVVSLKGHQDITSTNSWVFLMSLAAPLQLFVVYNLTAFAYCAEPAGVEDANYTTLYFHEGVRCYEGAHRTVAMLALASLTFYVFTTLIRIPEYTSSRSTLLDVVSLDLYELHVRLAFVAAAFAAVFLRADRTAVAAAVALAAAWAACCTLLFPWAYDVPRCVSVDAVARWRAFCYAAAVAGVAGLEVGVRSTVAAGAAVAGAAGGCAAVVLAVSLARLWREDTTGLDLTPEQVQDELLVVCGILEARGHLSERMNVARWRSFVGGNVRSSQLALAAMQLEHFTNMAGVDPIFMSLRAAWYAEMWSYVDVNDTRDDYYTRLSDDWDVWDDSICDCFCPCNGVWRDKRIPQNTQKVNTAVDLPKVFELLCKFGNAVKAPSREEEEEVSVEPAESSASIADADECHSSRGSLVAQELSGKMQGNYKNL